MTSSNPEPKYLYKDANLKITIEKTPYGKDWMYVDVLRQDHKYLPSFRQWYFMLRALARCEELKYPNLPWPATNEIRKFLNACIDQADNPDAEGAWEALRAQYKLPDRGDCFSIVDDLNP